MPCSKNRFRHRTTVFTAVCTASSRTADSALVSIEIEELVCELPATTGVASSRWSCAELAREHELGEAVPGPSGDLIESHRNPHFRDVARHRRPDGGASATSPASRRRNEASVAFDRHVLNRAHAFSFVAWPANPLLQRLEGVMLVARCQQPTNVDVGAHTASSSMIRTSGAPPPDTPSTRCSTLHPATALNDEPTAHSPANHGDDPPYRSTIRHSAMASIAPGDRW